MSELASKGKEKQKEIILKENLWKVMVKLSWPAIIAMVLYGMNAVISAIFVGRFVGETALAGVSVAYPLTQISLGIGSLIGAGAGAVLSIAIGRQDKKAQERLLGNVNYLSVIITIIYMVLALIFSEELVSIMGGQGEALVQGEHYFRITVFGSIFWIYGLASNLIIRAEGKMKSAAVVMAAGLAVDAMFNYIFVGVLGLGVEGSAWATNIGMLVYTLMGIIYFQSGFASFKTKALSIYSDRETVKSIIGLGMSSFIMTFMSIIQGVVVFNALARYGTVVDVAFYGVVFRIFTFLLTPIFGLMRALQPVIGINYGAKQYDRVISSYKIFTVAAMLLTLPFWIVSMLSPQSILALMLPNESFTGIQFTYFRMYMVILPLLSAIFMAMTLFPSIDKGKPAAVIGIARQLIFYIPVMLILPRIMGVYGVYFGSLAIDSIIVLWTVTLVKKEFTILRKSHIQPEKLNFS